MKRPLHPQPDGTYSRYKPEYAAEAAKLCERLAATNADLARYFNCSINSIHRWRAQFPEFAEATKLNKDKADDRMEASLYERGIGYSHDAVHILSDGTQIQITKHYPPDTAAAFIWLKNRRPEAWRDRQELETSGRTIIVVEGGPPKAEPETDDDGGGSSGAGGSGKDKP